jgi:hypothetical protein
LTEETIQKMKDYEKSDLPEREKIALRFADIILTDPQKLDEAFFKRMKEYFTEEQVIDMGMGVGFLHGTQRFIESMGIVPESYDEGAYCELPFESRLRAGNNPNRTWECKVGASIRFDAAGTYRPVFLMGMAVSATGVALAWMLKPTVRKGVNSSMD